MSRFLDALRRFGNAVLLRKTRSVIPSYHLSPLPAPRKPPYNYDLLYDFAENSWILQEVFNVIITEVKRPGWKIVPRFRKKCEVCGWETQRDVDECELCGGKVRPPSPAQLRIAQKLITHPNSQYSFGDLIGSIIYHDLVADDWFISIAPAVVVDEKTGEKSLIPAEIYAESSRYVRIVADEYGNLGKDEYYCPICYKPDEYYDKPGTCPKCGLPLERTAYIQVVNGEITARWSTERMVHGSTGRVAPSLFGRPKIIPLWEPLNIIKAFDEYNLDAYSEGKVAMILNFPGYSQEQVSALQHQIQQEITRLEKQDKMKGYRPKKTLRQLLLGSEKPIQAIKAMPDLSAMQSLQFYLLYIQAVCGLYGVQPVFISLRMKETGAGTIAPYIQLEINNRRIREIQRDKEEVFNEDLFPKFGITDWMFKFNPPERKDELRAAQIFDIKAGSLATLRGAGIDARLNPETGEIEILGYDLEVQSKRREGKQKQRPKISGASEGIIEGTTTERFPHGPVGRPPE